jgi:hypothetical protein
MAVFFNNTQSEVYIGVLKAGADLTPGVMVVPDWAAGTCASPATDAAGDVAGLMMVANYDSYADTDMTNSSAFKVASDEYVRMKPLEVGDIFTTDQVIGTPSVGDILAINGTAGSGTVGKWIAIGARTPVIKVKVIEVTTMYGSVTAYKCIVLSA